MMNKEEKIVNGYYQSNIKTSRNEDSVYAMKYASQQMLIEDLQQRIDKAIELLEKTDYEYSSRTELFNIISEVTETLGGKK